MKELKDFIHLYLGCECVIGSDLSTKETVQAVSKDSVCVGINKYGVESWYKTKSIKLILRPLNDMTDEEEKESGDNPETVFEAAEQIEYLLSKHFDLFGLIEAGLAIDKTTLK